MPSPVISCAVTKLISIVLEAKTVLWSESRYIVKAHPKIQGLGIFDKLRGLFGQDQTHFSKSDVAWTSESGKAEAVGVQLPSQACSTISSTYAPWDSVAPSLLLLKTKAM